MDLVWLLGRGQIPPKKRVVLGPEEAIATPFSRTLDTPDPATLSAHPGLEDWRARGKPRFKKGEKVTRERWEEVFGLRPDPRQAMVSLGPWRQRRK